MTVCSLIVRTKNEDRWIDKLLAAVEQQSFRDYEIIVVDNNSSDSTLQKAQGRVDKIIQIEKFLPGLALNMGCKEARGDYFVCMSAHSIPTSEHWLERLVSKMKQYENEGCVGVYGRQLPYDFSSAQTKRDLAITFGLDERVQRKDPFFHNANSLISAKAWRDIPFDENTTNIEDRIWAEQQQKKGNTIVYTPDAAVYHFHGIHQDNKKQRALNTGKVLSRYSSEFGQLDIKSAFTNCGIIFCAKIDEISNTLIKRLHQDLLSTAIFDRIVLVSSSPQAGNVLDDHIVAEFPDGYASSIPEIVTEIEKQQHFDNFFVLDESYPFRTQMFFEALYESFILSDAISMTCTRKEKRNFLISGSLMQQTVELGQVTVPKSARKTGLLVSAFGAGTFMRSFIAKQALSDFQITPAEIFVIEDSLVATQILEHDRDSLKALLINDKY